MYLGHESFKQKVDLGISSSCEEKFKVEYQLWDLNISLGEKISKIVKQQYS